MKNIKPMENYYDKSKFKILNEIDPYKILGIEDNATLEEINTNYKKLAKEFHPDRHMNGMANEKKEIEVLFSKITSAFNLLKDSDERKKFDYEKRMRRQREEMLKEIKSTNGTGNLNPHQKQSGGINISSIFTDNKVDVNEIKHKKAENLFNSGIIKHSKGELDAAIADIQAAIELNGKIARYHSKLGLIMKEKGWNGYAMAEFKIALNFDPNDNLALEHYKTSPLNNTSPLNKTSQETTKDKSGNSILNRVKNIFKKS